MTVTIELTTEIEAALRRRAAASGEDLETYVRQLVANSLIEESEVVPPRRSAAEFEQRLDAWIATLPRVDHEIDDSRESIYEGCGE